jgi:tetratricopeptide (TPR) repeat protein
MAGSSDQRRAALRDRIDQAMRAGRSSRSLVGMLERLAREAPRGSDDAVFAHRQLADLVFERAPWRALLHLRHVLAQRIDDEAALAMQGYCHARLGNLGAAAAAYRRALNVAPDSPWYHHHLGTLLDIGLGRPRDALPWLERAVRLAPREDDLCAALGQCLARLGRIDEAGAMLQEAVRLCPTSPDHRETLAWVQAGAPGELAPPRAPFGGGTQAGDPVETLLIHEMSSAAFRGEAIAEARAMWRTYARTCKRRAGSVAVYAAAVELAFARSAGRGKTTPHAVASRYGVGSRSVERRSLEIAAALRQLRR